MIAADTPSRPQALRIAMVANIRLPADNAGARRVTILAGAFARLGHAVTLFMPFPRQPLTESDAVPGVAMRWGAYPDPRHPWRLRDGRVVVGTQLAARAVWVWQMLLATLRAEYDWLYLYHPSPEGAVMACFARLAGRRVAVEQVDGFYYTLEKFTVLDFLHLHLHKLSVGIAKCLASLVLVISSTLADQSRGHYALLRVPALVDCARFRGGDASRMRGRLGGRKKRWIVYTGSLGAHAGFQFLLAAMVEVVKRVPDASLAFAGDPRDVAEPPRTMIEKHRLQDSAEYLGLLNYQEVIDLLALADVVVMPKAASALNEMGFPTKVAEYLASGRPVVATRISDISEYLSNGRNAYLCSPGDAAALAQSIVEALEAGEEARARVGEAGRLVACNAFDVTSNASRILEAMTVGRSA